MMYDFLVVLMMFVVMLQWHKQK